MKLLALALLFISFAYANTGPRAITANEPAIDSSLETQDQNAKWEGRDPASKRRENKKKEDRKMKNRKKAKTGSETSESRTTP